MTRRCDGCRHWSPFEGSRDAPGCPEMIGACTRYPPTILPRLPDENRTQAMPQTAASNWCGEWAANEES